MRFGAIIAFVVLLTIPFSLNTAYGHPVVDLKILVPRSNLILIGTVTNVKGFRYTNSYGDQLIHSFVKIHVSSTLKGKHRRMRTVRMIGGTVGSTKMKNSNYPLVENRETALLFMRWDEETQSQVLWGKLVPTPENIHAVKNLLKQVPR